MYSIDSVLGKGTYGKVYAGSNLLSRRPVAIKRLLIDPETKGSFVMSLREMDMMARLQHPHILPLTEVLFDLPPLSPLQPQMRDDKVAFVMPRAKTTVDKHVTRLTPMSDRKELLWQLVSGVQHIHRNNVVHRDLKPQNLLIFEPNTLKIGDFGLATPCISGDCLTPQMMTIWYRAPEVLLNKYYDMTADVWSMGCIFFEIICGEAPFREVKESMMINRIFALLAPERLITLPIPKRVRSSVHIDRLEGVALKLHKALGLKLSEIEAFGSESYLQFLDLLRLMLTLDQRARPSTELLLRHEYFDSYRTRLAVAIQPSIDQHRLVFSDRRLEAVEIIAAQRYAFQYRVKFLALDLVDRVLVFDPEPTVERMRQYSICCLYIAEKYFMNERCCALSDLVCTRTSDLKNYGQTEQFILQEVLRYKIYRTTLYDYLYQPSGKELSRAYLLFRAGTVLDGIRIDELYNIYAYVVQHYYSEEACWPARISMKRVTLGFEVI